MAVFKPAFPAVLPNPQNVLEGAIATKCSIVAAAPTFLEVYSLSFVRSYLIRMHQAWSRDPGAVEYLKTTNAVVRFQICASRSFADGVLSCGEEGP
jgi:hypothetical protein